MYIFSSSPRNQLPNHGLRAGDKYYWQEVPATTSSNSEPQQLTGLGLASGVKYGWKTTTTTSSCSLRPSLLLRNQLF